ncbi:hypothetical protein CC80DRAFT_280851 [Byssothecium circinans]|uniref:Uncharacterized protein n=1 Tax=Byssothecium circinans TaxID=147558 RepID=A0A6A5TE92_9PLEO|nr:hypothetical protein CC80DRAFT_280851 [Byssothecium circinans]
MSSISDMQDFKSRCSLRGDRCGKTWGVRKRGSQTWRRLRKFQACSSLFCFCALIQGGIEGVRKSIQNSFVILGFLFLIWTFRMFV